MEHLNEPPHDIFMQDTLEGRRQLMALAFFHLFPDKEFTLTGDGHFDVHEQLINFVKSKYDQLAKE